MGRFETSAAYYTRGRQPYGPAFFKAVADRLGDRKRLLDLGTGPGLLALGFAPYFDEIAGLDPEPAMLEAARVAAGRAGVAIRWIEGKAETLDSETLGRFDTITIGRALHWMEPDPARATLDRLASAQGRVVICHARSATGGRNPWLEAYEDVRSRWPGEFAAKHYRIDLDTFFAPARFRRAGEVRTEFQQTVSTADLTARIYSMSSSSPARLGSDAPDMERALADALAPFVADGAIVETVESIADIFACGATGRP